MKRSSFNNIKAATGIFMNDLCIKTSFQRGKICESGYEEGKLCRLINFIMKGFSHLKLDLSPVCSSASSCDWKCILGYGDVVCFLVVLLIIHDSLAEPQKAKPQTILHLSIFMGHQVKSPQLFAFKSKASWVSEQMSLSHCGQRDNNRKSTRWKK